MFPHKTICCDPIILVLDIFCAHCFVLQMDHIQAQRELKFKNSNACTLMAVISYYKKKSMEKCTWLDWFYMVSPAFLFRPLPADDHNLSIKRLLEIF